MSITKEFTFEIDDIPTADLIEEIEDRLNATLNKDVFTKEFCERATPLIEKMQQQLAEICFYINQPRSRESTVTIFEFNINSTTP